MTDLRLESDEGILLQTTDVGRYDGNNELEIKELYLTNKNLISAYKKSNGSFTKSEIIIDRIPLTSICITNGIVQVEQVNDDDYGKALQLIYTNGKRELFQLNVSHKKEYPKWKEAISSAVLQVVNNTSTTIPSIPIVADVKVDNTVEKVHEQKAKKSLFGALPGALNMDIQSVVGKAQTKIAGFPQQMTEKAQAKIGVLLSDEEIVKSLFEALPGALNMDIQSVVGKAQTKIAEFPQQMAEKAQAKIGGLLSDDDNEEIVISNIEEKKEGKCIFCSNCETKLNEGAKFCYACGSAAGAAQVPATPTIPQTPDATNSGERRQEYVGKILKCPNCGATITQTTAICPDCGIQITSRAAVSSLQAFKEQLMAIEISRKVHCFNGFTRANKRDIQKLSLIRNFSIPNSIDDCLELMMLAIANIDVNLSKNTFINRYNEKLAMAVTPGKTRADIDREISNAWVTKIEQVYRKAEIVFPNDPAFVGIQKMYFDKMKELNIKAK